MSETKRPSFQERFDACQELITQYQSHRNCAKSNELESRYLDQQAKVWQAKAQETMTKLIDAIEALIGKESIDSLLRLKGALMQEAQGFGLALEADPPSAEVTPEEDDLFDLSGSAEAEEAFLDRARARLEGRDDDPPA